MSSAKELSQEDFKKVRDVVAVSMDDGNPAPHEVVAAERLVDLGLIDVQAALDAHEEAMRRW